MKTLFLTAFIVLSSISIAQVPAYVPVNGLQSYWPFSGNGNDASNNGGDLTNHGAVLTTDRFGTTNSAYSFNGSNQYLDDQTPVFTFGDTSDFTISMWMKKTAVVGGIAMMNGSNAGGNFIWLLSSGATTANVTYGTNKQQSSWTFISAPYTVNSWEHIVCTYQSGAMSLYVNNVLVNTGSMSHPNVTTANLPLYIGRGIGGNYYNGTIDDIGIWDRVLTSCERTDLFNSTQTLTTVSAGPDSTACANSAFVLSGSGASTYVWDNGVMNGVSFNPTSTQTYTVTGTNAAGCSGWDQMTITTIASQISAGQDQTICVGSTTTVNGSGGTNYTWDNGVTNGVPFTPTTTTYTVTGTGTNGCVGSDQVVITQYLPLINAGPSSINVCEGNSVTLSGSGGDTYTWDNGVLDSVPFVPTSSATYTVVGTDTAGCSNTDQIQVNVVAAPVISAGPDITICAGESVTLNATGANAFSWNNGVSNNVPFSPTTTDTYVVIAANSSNCTGTDSVLVTVNQPSSSTLTISSIDQYVLNGETYTASGTYMQTLTNAQGCDSIITLNLTLGFTGLEENDLLSINYYPNPTKSVLNINITTLNEALTLEIFSADGRLIKTISLQDQNNQLDVSELASGNYMVSVKSKNGNQSQFMFVKE